MVSGGKSPGGVTRAVVNTLPRNSAFNQASSGFMMPATLRLILKIGEEKYKTQKQFELIQYGM